MHELVVLASENARDPEAVKEGTVPTYLNPKVEAEVEVSILVNEIST
tara:strand:+ start:117 stop:257 length:141 start_codon:yes stop_codon:yes gene_type:complete